MSGELKTYMDYRKITDKSSIEWELQQLAHTDKEGFRRIGDLYMVSFGTYYMVDIWDTFEIELSSGKVFKCIVSNVKPDKNSDSTKGYVVKTENTLEFIVDAEKINKLSNKMGDMSYSGMDGKITRIREITDGNKGLFRTKSP